MSDRPGRDTSESFRLEANDYLTDCFRLARKIWEDGYRPDYMVALWRGGAPPGIVVQEYFRWRGHDPYHTAIRTQSLEGVLYGGGFDIKGLEHVIDEVEAHQSLLIIDNLFCTGRTIFEVSEHLRRRARRNTPEIRVATVYFCRGRQRFLVGPHYWLHETEGTPIFPHQLTALDLDGLADQDPELLEAIRGAHA